MIPHFPIIELLPSEGWLFWLLLLATIIAAYATMPTTKNIPVSYGSTATGAFAALFLLFGPREYVEQIYTAPWKVAAYIFGYVVIGAAVAAGKWDRFLVKRKGKLREEEVNWLQENHPEVGTTMPDNLVTAFKAHLATQERWTVYVKGRHVLQVIPRIWNYKQQWMAWAIWWPLSASYYVVVEFGAGIFQSIWTTMSGWMDRWSRWRFSDYKKYE